MGASRAMVYGRSCAMLHGRRSARSRTAIGIDFTATEASFMRPFGVVLSLILALAAAVAPAQAQEKWVTAWAASVQGPYPVGNPSAQPDLRFAFPSPATGARDQTFRLIVTPDIWGREMRLRLSNAFGPRPVTFDGVRAGLQLASAGVAAGSSRPVNFAGKPSVTIPPGESVWSDAVALPFVSDGAALVGRRLAVTFHVAGESGPMTWHAKALTTSYVTAPGAGAVESEDEAGFP